MLYLERTGIYDRKNITPSEDLIREALDDASQISLLSLIQKGIRYMALGSSHSSGLVPSAIASSGRKTVQTTVRRLLVRGKIEEAMDHITHYAQKSNDKETLQVLLMLSGQWYRVSRCHAQGTMDAGELNLEYNKITVDLTQLVYNLAD